MNVDLNRLAKGLAMIIDRLTPKPIDNVIYDLANKSSMVKIKGNALEIGKVICSFVEFDIHSHKLKGNIDIYFSVDAARAFCHDILSGKLCKLAQREKERCAKSGEQYPKEVYISPLGGTTEEKAKERNLRTDGKAISRLFKLSPGSKADFVFTAEQRPGHTDKNKGIIIPEGGKPEVLIRVSCTKEQLKELALALQEHMLAFTTSQYVHNGFARQQKKK